jgi:hypothetical protein
MPPAAEGTVGPQMTPNTNDRRLSWTQAWRPLACSAERADFPVLKMPVRSGTRSTLHTHPYGAAAIIAVPGDKAACRPASIRRSSMNEHANRCCRRRRWREPLGAAPDCVIRGDLGAALYATRHPMRADTIVCRKERLVAQVCARLRATVKQRASSAEGDGKHDSGDGCDGPSRGRTRRPEAAPSSTAAAVVGRSGGVQPVGAEAKRLTVRAASAAGGSRA